LIQRLSVVTGPSGGAFGARRPDDTTTTTFFLSATGHEPESGQSLLPRLNISGSPRCNPSK
jgi:hypothetical protein